MKAQSTALVLGLLLAATQAWSSEIKTPHWNYQGEAGSAQWGELSPEFATCKLGKNQSPIDIRSTSQRPMVPLRFAYQVGAAEVINNGHTIQVNPIAGGVVDLAGDDYRLVQLHFHTPSEEKINGQSYPMVAHLVHKNEQGELAVVAVLFQRGKHNAALEPVFAALPEQTGETKRLAGNFDPNELLPTQRNYYAYTGSLTTPPCTEGVRWQVLKQPVEISDAQLARFRALYPMNARPVQPINDRTILESL